MKNQLLAGSACAALIALAQPAFAATSPELPGASATRISGSDAVDQFYRSRANTPMWTAGLALNPAAGRMLQILDRAPLDGLASGPSLAGHIRALAARGAIQEAERALSVALIVYAQAVQTPPPGMTYGDSWVAPRQSSPAQILAAAVSAPSLSDHVTRLSAVNPVYANLRDAAYAEASISGSAPDQRVVASLARARQAPFQDRYVMVDTASATLWMIEDGKIADSMKVIVGSAEAPTPMLASTIYRATLNPYWNVPGDLTRTLIAPRIVAQGTDYLKIRNYEVLDSYAADANVIDPDSVDWKAVVAGTKIVKLRRGPDAANSMGKMKFGFPNASDIYLHDSPTKDLFAAEDRNLSHGCIRLSDAPKLARWLLGRSAKTSSDEPEQQVLLPTPVPIYITYLTAQAVDGRIAFVDDVYGRDRTSSSAVASLR